MPIPESKDELTALFRRLGAREPESWAASQIDEGIPQLHRFLFLRQCWARIEERANPASIDAVVEAAEREPSLPFAGAGLVLKRCLEAGVDRADLVELLRAVQAEFLFEVCYLLEDPSLYEPELDDVGWCVVSTDENFEPTRRSVGGLYESVLDMDPSGRECKPSAV